MTRVGGVSRDEWERMERREAHRKFVNVALGITLVGILIRIALIR